MKSIPFPAALMSLCLFAAGCDRVVESEPNSQPIPTSDTTSRVNDDATRAAPLELGGPSRTDTLRADGEDWFVFPADSGAFYLLEIESGLTNVTGILWEPGLARDFDPSDNTTMSRLITLYPGIDSTHFRASRTGSVYLRISSREIEDTGAYRISLSVDTTGIDAFEPDDSQGSASTLIPDGREQQHFLREREHDWIRVPVVAGMGYRVVGTGSNGYKGYTLPYTLHQASSFEDSVILVQEDTLFFTPSRTGDVFLDLTGWGAYTISVHSDSSDRDEFEPDDLPSRATALPERGIAQTHALARGNTDYVRFHADSGSVYTVSATFSGSGAGILAEILNTADTTWSYTVPGPDGIRYPVAHHTLLYVQDADSATFTALRTRDYLIKVTGRDATSRGTYTIAVHRK